jgi:Protein of unknown function (DUF3667)
VVSGDVEVAADVVSGAVLARAVEPAAGESAARGTASACLNCGAPLVAAYCGACGQKARVHRTLAAFGHDALHSLLHFDGKVWRTLPLLAWRPGQLTRRYVHGERAKFVSPLALFLLCVFLAFAVFSWALPKAGSLQQPTVAEIEKELAETSAEIAAEIKELESERIKAGAGASAVAAIDKQIADQRKTLAKTETEALGRLRQVKAAQARIAADKSRSEAAVASLEARLAEAKKTGATTQAIEDELAAEKFNQQLAAQAAELLAKNPLGGAKLHFEFGSEGLNIAADEAVKNPQLLLYKIQSNAYKFAWALIPLSMPFVWLLFFWKREFKLFDHAVFVTYSLCFMLMLATVLALAMRLPQLEAAGGLAMMFIPPLHMYRQVRHAYGLTHWSAVWRTLLLLAFASTALGLFGALIVALGVAG